MLDSLNRLGEKLTSLFGDPDKDLKGHSKKSQESSRQYLQFDTLSSLLNYEAYDEESGLFINANSIGFIIEASPLVGGDGTAQKEMASIYEELLEEGASIQCLLLADHRLKNFFDAWTHVRKGKQEIFEEIAKQRCNFFAKSEAKPKNYRFILSYSISNDADLKKTLIQKTQQKKEKALRILKALTHAFPWEPQDFLDTLNNFVSFSSEPVQQGRKYNPYQTLSSQLTTGGRMSVEEEGINYENDASSFFKSYRVIDYPEEWSLNAMHNLIGDPLRENFRVNAPFFIHYGVHCPKQSKEVGSFWKKSHIIENQGRSQALVRMIPELSRELQECDIIRRQLNEGARFVWSGLYVGLWSPKEQFNNYEQSLKSLFRLYGFRLTENKYIHLPMLLYSLPMSWGEYIQEIKALNVLRTTLSTESNCFVPIQGEWVGTPSPGTLLIGRRGQLLNWNPFDNKSGNYNTVVVGRSGSGKSVFMQEILMNGLGIGAKVFVLEVGRSFEKMCSVVDGQHIEFSRVSPICLNPFTKIPLNDPEETLASFSFLKSVISCMAAPTEGTSDIENAFIEKGIGYAWEKKKNKASITDVAEFLLKHEDQRAKSLGTMLMPFTKGGVYAKYFEGENNVDFRRPFVLIELEELKEKKDLQSVILQLFIMTITTQAFLGDRKTPFYICIDEAWDLLRAKQTGPFIEALARRLRKYFGSLLVGTQSIEDFFATPGAKAAFENSDWMCLLSQKKSSISRLSELGEFNERKMFALESVTTRHGEFSEVMICDADGGFSIARLMLDPFSQLLYSTKAQEYARFKELRGQGLSTIDALNRMKNEKF